MNKIKCFIFDQDGTFYSGKSVLTNTLRKKTKKLDNEETFIK